jgi:hypothetical protein
VTSLYRKISKWFEEIEKKEMFSLSAKSPHKFVEAFLSVKTIFFAIFLQCAKYDANVLLKKKICIEKQFLLYKRFLSSKATVDLTSPLQIRKPMNNSLD